MLPTKSSGGAGGEGAAPLQLPPTTRSLWSRAVAIVRAALTFAPAEQDVVERVDDREETGSAVEELPSDAVLIDGEAHKALSKATLDCDAVDKDVSSVADEDEMMGIDAAEEQKTGAVVVTDSVLTSGDGLDGAALSDTVASEVVDDSALNDAALSSAVDASVYSAADDNHMMNNGAEEEQSSAVVSGVVLNNGRVLSGATNGETAEKVLSDAVLGGVELVDVANDCGDKDNGDCVSDDADGYEYGDAACEAIGGGNEEEERTGDFGNTNDCEQDSVAVCETTSGGCEEEREHAAADVIVLLVDDDAEDDDDETDESEEDCDDDNDEDYEEEVDDDDDDDDAASIMSIDSEGDDCNIVDERKLLKLETHWKVKEEQVRKIKREHNTVRSRSPLDFRCDVATCGASFTKRENLVRHIAGYHEAKPGREYRCDPCDLQFLTRHEKELHSREVNHQRFPCTLPDCGKSYSKREHLNRHVLTAHSNSKSQEKPFRCELCGIGFAYAHGLVRHQNRSHVNQNKPYECAQCLLAFKKKSDLQAHSYVHTGVLPFECDDCGARFAKRFQLVRHERTHSGKKKPQAQVFFCEEDGCSEMLLSAEEKRKHDKEAHNKEELNAEVKQEDKSKEPSGSMKKHSKKRRRRSDSVVADVKPLDTTITTTTTNEGDPEANRRQLLMCQVCERTFQRKQYLRAHLRTHFEQLDERKMHVCPMINCANVYTRKSNLMAHYNAVHDTVRSQRFVCPFEGCEGKFGYKKVLTTHIDSVHLNPTPVKKRRTAGVKAVSARARALGLDREDSTSSNNEVVMVVVDSFEESACS